MSAENPRGKGSADGSNDSETKEFVCSACGSEHDTQTGLSIHETKTHNGPVDSEGKDCPGCERAYQSQQGLINHLSGKNSCGAGHECGKCGRVHPTKRGLQHHKKEAHNIDARPEIACTVCGDTRQVDPNYLDKAERHFCGSECWSEWRAENWSGEDNPLWRGGGRLEYGTGWQKQRKKALERDGYACQSCGISNEEHREKYGVELHVHHIRPLRDFDDPDKANDLSNLVCFCQACHKRWEGIPVRPELD